MNIMYYYEHMNLDQFGLKREFFLPITSTLFRRVFFNLADSAAIQGLKREPGLISQGHFWDQQLLFRAIFKSGIGWIRTISGLFCRKLWG